MSSDDAPPAVVRSRSQAVATEAIAAVKAQSDKFVSEGMSRLSFFFGVANFGVSAFLIGRFPQHYWLFHLLKGVIYFPLRIARQIEQNTLFDLAEICWVWNALFIVGLALVAANEYLGGESLISATTLRQGFLVFFMLGSGPLGLAVVALGNALIFHSIDHTASVFIHSGPMLSAWSLLGYVAVKDVSEVVAAYPAIGSMLQGLIDNPPVPWPEMIAPALGCYLAWWLPYAGWLLASGPDERSLYMRGFNKGIQRGPAKALAGGSARRGALVYCVGHLLAFGGGFALAAFLFNSYAAYTVFAFAMLLGALWNGASRYNYYLLEVYEKRLSAAVEKASAEKGDGAGVGGSKGLI